MGQNTVEFSDGNFKEDVIDSSKPVLVDFYISILYCLLSIVGLYLHILYNYNPMLSFTFHPSSPFWLGFY